MYSKRLFLERRGDEMGANTAIIKMKIAQLKQDQENYSKMFENGSITFDEGLKRFHEIQEEIEKYEKMLEE